MRNLDGDLSAAVQGERLAPIGLVELDYDSGSVYLWTGVGELVWNGNTYIGAGDGGADGKQQIGRVGAIEETTEIRAVRVQLELSGCAPEVLAIAVAEDWQGRPVRVRYAVLQGRAIVGTPLLLFSGLIDNMTVGEGDQASLVLTCESKQIDLERTRARRYTAEDQRAEYPGDKGLDVVAALQEREVHWGRA